MAVFGSSFAKQPSLHIQTHFRPASQRSSGTMATPTPWENVTNVNETYPMFIDAFHSFNAFVNAMALNQFFFYDNVYDTSVQTTQEATLVGEHIRLSQSQSGAAGPWILFWLQNVEAITETAWRVPYAPCRWVFHGTRLQMLGQILTTGRLVRNPHHNGDFEVWIRGVKENRQEGRFFDGKGGVWSSPDPDTAECYAYPEPAGVVLQHYNACIAPTEKNHMDTLQIMLVCELCPPWEIHGKAAKKFCTLQTQHTDCIIAIRAVLVRPWDYKKGKPIKNHYPALGNILELESEERQSRKKRQGHLPTDYIAKQLKPLVATDVCPPKCFICESWFRPRYGNTSYGFLHESVADGWEVHDPPQ